MGKSFRNSEIGKKKAELRESAGSSSFAAIANQCFDPSMILFLLCPIPLRTIIQTTFQSNKQGVEHRINLDAADYSANEVIGEKTLQLTGTPNTMLIPLSEFEQSPLLTAQNSSPPIVWMALSCCGRCVWLENSSVTLRLFPSLVETVSTDCFVGLHDLTLEDGIVCGDEPLLESKETSSVLSSNSKMWNITHTARSHPHTMSETARKTSLISTRLEAVDDPFYGSIVAHINTGGEFLISNCSFKSLVGNAETVITCPVGGCKTHLDHFTSSALTVTNCDFLGCSSQDRGGCFAYGLASGLFTCENSSFTDCMTGLHGGGFEIQENAQSTIVGTRFTNCRAASCGGGIVVSSAAKRTCGSGLHRNVPESSTTISGLIFDDCEAKCGLNFDEIGSACSLFLDLSKATHVSSCSIKNTLLGLDGAAISCNFSPGCTLSAKHSSMPRLDGGGRLQRTHYRYCDVHSS
ncbi:hypothetical protein BLNAU_17499 [Blattamonas nauphoetae]|uniref:Right handed beta helix domain-containing protein n=1 Tax=Blattamonas nauphoetae TaxID=2049346 RepID=A0ABQ9X7B9_9EUKA|nr:hypothetical protein BLNAU_17499 [Blattamonas nauphoetae]